MMTHSSLLHDTLAIIHHKSHQYEYLWWFWPWYYSTGFLIFCTPTTISHNKCVCVVESDTPKTTVNEIQLTIWSSDSFVSLCNSTMALYGQVFRGKHCRTREAEAKRMTILTAICHGGLSVGYTCCKKASYAFLNTQPTHVMQVEGRLVTPSAKNKSCKGSSLCIACYECKLPSS